VSIEDTTSATPAGLPRAQGWQVRLHPNPGQEAFHLSQAQPEALTIQVFDLWGRKVWSGQSAQRDTRIEAAAWPSGMYLVRVQ